MKIAQIITPDPKDASSHATGQKAPQRIKTLQSPFSARRLTGWHPEARGHNNGFRHLGAGQLPNGLQPGNGSTAPESQICELTTREREVLQRIAEGDLNKQMAAALCISIKTVEKHRQGLMNKLGIRGIAGLTRYAVAAGIV